MSISLASLTQSLLPAVQEHLPKMLSRLQKQREVLLYTQFFSEVKDLQINKVPIFTRLKSFNRIQKGKPLTVQGYLDEPKK